MQPNPPRFDPRSIEAASRRYLEARGLLESDGPLGPTGGALTHQIVATVFPSDHDLAIVQREANADAYARYLTLAGRRVWTSVEVARPTEGTAVPDGFDRARELAVRTTGLGRPLPHASVNRLQDAAERLVQRGWLTARSHPIHACPQCRTPRTPETTVYAEEDGTVYLVAIPVRGIDPPTRALVWVESAWKLLAASALLLHPERPYVRATIRRHGSDTSVLLARSAIGRLSAWLPGAEVEVAEERSGAGWVGMAYEHPLALEYPAAATLLPPAGTLLASPHVEDAGTGIVLLAPSHGGQDAEVAQSLGLGGHPVLTPDGRMDSTLVHKYAGLPLDAAEAFALRDLTEGGHVFARIRDRRGVPRCALCGSALVWTPARTWAIHPDALRSQLAPEVARLLPGSVLDRPPSVPWPLTDATESVDGTGVELRECDECDRLALPSASERCACGGMTRPVRRRWLPAVDAALRGWARHVPFGPGDSVRLLVPDRRRVPSVVHFLLAREALGDPNVSIRVAVLPTLATSVAVDPASPPSSHDPLRSALVSADGPLSTSEGLAQRRRREDDRLRAVWAVVAETIDAAHALPESFALEPVSGRTADLLPEDRALLSAFERVRREALRAFDAGEIAAAARCLGGFWDLDLRRDYLAEARGRLAASRPLEDRTVVVRVLTHVVPRWAELYSPVAPYTMEAVHRAFRGDAECLAELTFAPLEEGWIDPALAGAPRRWSDLGRALARERRRRRLDATTAWPTVVCIANDESLAAALDREAATLARRLRATSLTIASPRSPWAGRRVRASPVLSEIQRVYPAEASRILRLLERLPSYRVQDGLRDGTLTVTLDARPVVILPSMFALVETVPDGFVPVPWPGGQLFVELPPGGPPSVPPQPELSFEAYRVVEAAQRHLRRAASPPVRVRIHAEPPLREELLRRAPEIARFLGVPVQVSEGTEGFVASETRNGRTRRGVGYAIHVSGVPATRRRRKVRPAPSPARRPRRVVPRYPAAREPEPAVEAVAEPWDEIRAAVSRFDADLGLPLMGPSKLRMAWEAGLHGYDAIRAAPFDALAPIPGFGPQVAAHLVRHFGGTVPHPLPRAPERSPVGRASPNVGAVPEGAPPVVDDDPSIPGVLAGAGAAGIPPDAVPPAVPLPSAAAAPVESGRAPTGGGGPAGGAPAAPGSSLPAVPDVSARGTAIDDAAHPAAPSTVSGSPPEADRSDERGPSASTVASAPASAPASPLTVPGAALGSVAHPEPTAGPSLNAVSPGLASAIPTPPLPAQLPVPAIPEEVPPPAPIPSTPPPSGVELWVEGSGPDAWEKFLDSTGAGLQGLCVSREFPDRLRAYLGRRAVEILWLSNSGREGAVRPADLDSIESAIRKGLSNAAVSIVYLGGIEYLVSIRPVPTVLAFLARVDSVARERLVRVILPVNPLLVAADRLEELRGALHPPAP